MLKAIKGFFGRFFKSITSSNYFVGMRLYNTGSYAEAAEAFSKAKSGRFLTSFLYRKLTDFYYFRTLRNAGVVAFYHDDYHNCAKELRAALEVYPESITCHNYLAHSYSRLGDIDRSVRHLEALLRFWPYREDVRYKLAIAYVKSGRLSEGIGILEELIERGMDFPDFNLLLGIAYSKRGNSMEAGHHLRRAAELNPDFTQALMVLGFHCITERDFRSATEAFQRAKESTQSDESAATYHALALAVVEGGRLQLGDSEEAIPDSLLESVNYLERQARKELDRVLDIKIDYGEQFEFLDPIYDTHCINLLVERFETLCREHADYADYAYNLGRFYLKLGELDKARVKFLWALELNPYYMEALDGLASALEKQGKARMALDVIDRMLTHMPTHPEVLHKRSRICIEFGQLEEAVQAMLMATQGDSRYAYHLFVLGQILEEQNHLEWARQCWVHVETYLPGLAGSDLRRIEKRLAAAARRG